VKPEAVNSIAGAAKDGQIVQPRGPRVGFLGVGWIGRHRLKAIAEARAAEIVALADFDTDATAIAAAEIPGARSLRSFESLLRLELDGVVIATPSALHAEQAVAALECGMAVFCQKPLGRTAAETRHVVETASKQNRLLGVDMCYRFLRGVTTIKTLLEAGVIGDLYALDLTFHNAYGPDKAWYYDPTLSGGGCVMDLGIHLIDLALWTLNFPKVLNVSSRLVAQGRPYKRRGRILEDFAIVRLDLETGATATLSCSWHLPAGREAIIRAFFYGTKGGLAIENVAGSFYDFRAEHFIGTRREILDEPPDQWGGRAALAWTHGLAQGGHYQSEIEHAIQVAEVIDAIYER
jgi:predicted dehydrogenase